MEITRYPVYAPMKSGSTVLLKRWVFLLLLIAAAFTGKAQIYPVQVSTQLTPPYSVYLPDYASPGGEKLRIVLLQRDLTVQGYRLRFEMRIQVNGVTVMQTSRSALPPPITLQPGVPTVLGGSDLSWYVQPQNLEFGGGYSSATYEQNRCLPEGPITITFTAYDYTRTDVQVSQPASTFFYATRDNPPLLNYPACGMQIAPITPQFMNFSWLPQNTSSPNSALNTNYLFSLWAVLPTGYSYQDIVSSSLPIYTTTVQQPSFVYGPGQPPLVAGQQYAWRVQAVDATGRDIFENNGFSQTCYFNYGGTDGQATTDFPAIQLSAASAGSAQGKVWWTGGTNVNLDTAGYTSYLLSYRKSQGNYNWETDTVADTVFRLFDLEPSTAYECRLQGYKNGSYGPYTDLANFTTDAAQAISCSQGASLLLPSSGQPLASASAGMNLTYGPWTVQLLTVTPLGGQGQFKGTCKVLVPFAGGASFSAKFDNLTIDDARNVTAGNIQFISTSMTGFIDSSINAQMGGSLYGQVVSGADTTNVTVPISLAGLTHLDVTDSTDGSITTIFIPNSPITISVNSDLQEVTLRDSTGATYALDNKGNLTQLTYADAGLSNFFSDPGNVAALNTLTTGHGAVVFREADGKFAFDAWQPFYSQASQIMTSQYEKLTDDQGGIHYVSQKAIGAGESDIVGLDIDLPDNMDEDSLVFATAKGEHLIWDPNDYTLNLLGGPAADAQEIYALYPKPGGGFYSLAKLLLSAYEQQNFTAVIVPVVEADGQVPSIDLQYLQDSINSIYNKVNINWTLEKAGPYTNTSWDADKDGMVTMSGSSFLSNKLVGEPAALISGFGSITTIDKSKIYLFVANASSGSTGEPVGLLGDMPRASQYGFVFLNANTAAGADPAATIAHEVGHGQFNLEHTFSADIALGGQKATIAYPNLMDYQVGNVLHLYKYQWNQIHQPGQVMGVFEKDGAGQMVGDGNYIAIDYCIHSADIKATAVGDKLTFVTPDGKFISLPKDGTSVNFIGNTFDRSSLPKDTSYIKNDWDNELEDSVQFYHLADVIVMPYYGNGVLHGFELRGVKYEAKWIKNGTAATFGGYFALGTNDPYPDAATAITACNSQTTVVCGFSNNPCEIKFESGTVNCGQWGAKVSSHFRNVSLNLIKVLDTVVRSGDCQIETVNLLRNWPYACPAITNKQKDSLATYISGLGTVDLKTLDATSKAKLINALLCGDFDDSYLDAITKILASAGVQEQLSLIQIFRDNNYSNLKYICKNYSSLSHFGSFIQQLSAMVEKNFKALNVPITQVTIDNYSSINGVTASVPAALQWTYYLGLSYSGTGNNTFDAVAVPNQMGWNQVSTAITSNLGTVTLGDDNKVRLVEDYGLTFWLNAIYETGTTPPHDYHSIDINQALDPFEPVQVQSVKAYEALGLDKNTTITVPVIWLVWAQKAADKSDFSEKIQMAGNLIQIGAAVLTDGASTPVAAFITQLSGAAGAINQALIVQKQTMSLQDLQNSKAFFDAWDKVYISVSVADGVHGLYEIGQNWAAYSQMMKNAASSAGSGLKTAWTILGDFSNWSNAAKMMGTNTSAFWKELLSLATSNTLKYANNVITDATGARVAETLADGSLQIDAVIGVDKVTDDFTVLDEEVVDKYTYNGATTENSGLMLVEDASGKVYCVGDGCFVSGTLVTTHHGLEAIEKVRAKDEVLSVDVQTGKKVWGTVLRTFTHKARGLVRVITGKDTLCSTSDHPYLTKEGWKRADSLRVGMKLRMAAGIFTAVTSVATLDTAAAVYNFTVDRTHTYTVGRQEIVVHNDCSLLKKLSQNVDPSLQQQFLKDFVGKEDVLQAIANNEITVDAWKLVVSQGKVLKTDINNLKAITKLLQNTEIDATKLQLAITYAAGSSGGLSAKVLLQKLMKYNSKEGIGDLVSNFAINSNAARGGATYVISVADQIEFDNLIGFESALEDDNITRYYDLKVKGSTGNVTVECKSWSVYRDKTIVNQFLKKDLNSMKTLEDVRWIVDQSQGKLLLADWYKNVRQTLLNNADAIYNTTDYEGVQAFFNKAFNVQDEPSFVKFITDADGTNKAKWFDVIFNQNLNF